MATLYEIDQAILDCIDFETGEIIDVEKLEKLQMERDCKIESIAKWIINLTNDAEAFKARKDYFAQREKIVKNKIERLEKYLTQATNEQPFITHDVSVKFTKSTPVEISDETNFIKWAQENDRDDLLTYKEPSANKTAIKNAINKGQKIEFCQIIEKQNIQIK